MPRQPDSSPQTLAVFAALLDQPDDWHYGYPLSKQTGLRPGTLYPILARLVDRELLETRWAENDSPGRPARHLYRLTGAGRALATDRLRAAPANRTATAAGRQATRTPRTAS
jgi:DNA-binding PadR family transcriptional regulator